ncbi:Histidine-phosphotransfer HPT protein [Rhizoctonia solani]|uniref:Histidine-phosphotransfer HPT protein n=1 Tax=Rhizoctonia solani TaxID=456999 RepID=A0A8H7IAQ8_9AGAM|nr:Histidine-phosphotransfer HPT protein [Rhizoctonia solani]
MSSFDPLPTLLPAGSGSRIYSNPDLFLFLSLSLPSFLTLTDDVCSYLALGCTPLHQSASTHLSLLLSLPLRSLCLPLLPPLQLVLPPPVPALSSQPRPEKTKAATPAPSSPPKPTPKKSEDGKDTEKGKDKDKSKDKSSAALNESIPDAIETLDIDESVFNQITEMDEEDDCEFSSDIVRDYFKQAITTLGELNDAYEIKGVDLTEPQALRRIELLMPRLEKDYESAKAWLINYYSNRGVDLEEDE